METQETDTVEPSDATLGPNPQITVPRLSNGLDVAFREAVFGVPGLETVLVYFLRLI
jgi:hypothetical protein